MGFNLASDAVGRRIGITKDAALESATSQFYKTRERERKEMERELKEEARELERERRERERELRDQMREAERELREQERHLARMRGEESKKKPARGGNVVGGNVIGGKKLVCTQTRAKFLPGAVLKSNLYDAFKA